MATFGDTTQAATYSFGYNDQSLGTRFQLTEAGSVSKLSAYIDNLDTSHALCHMRGVIYSDKAGPAPDALVGRSDEVTVADSKAAGWVDLTFATPVSLAAGYYWLGLHLDGPAAGLRFYRDDTGGSSWYRNDTYSDGTLDPIGSVNSSTRVFSIYATYTTATDRTPLIQFGIC